MSERTRDPIGPQEVEAFYRRQRRQILDRLEERPAGAIVHPQRRTWAWGGLAAAAAVVLAFVAFSALRIPLDTGPSAGDEAAEPSAADLLVGSLPDGITGVPYGLRAFGVWSDEVSIEDSVEDGSAVQEIDSLAWLLEDSQTPAAELPEFLEPFGTWDSPEPDEGGTT